MFCNVLFCNCFYLLTYNLLTSLKHFTVLEASRVEWSKKLFLPQGKCAQAEACANHHNSNKKIFIYDPNIISTSMGLQLLKANIMSNWKGLT